MDSYNEVKVTWHMSDWHVHLTTNSHTKYHWPTIHSNWETNLITKTWPWSLDHDNEVKVSWQVAGRLAHPESYIGTKLDDATSKGSWDIDINKSLRRRLRKSNNYV